LVSARGGVVSHDADILLWSGDRISGLVDWHDARLGPAASDVADITVNIARSSGLDVAEQFVDAYEQRRGRGPLDDLTRWHALLILSQLSWMHLWKSVEVPDGRPITRDVAQRRLDGLGDLVLARL
jgi:Ser/Thr protein kinase RdoA (MazF antagonist)